MKKFFALVVSIFLVSGVYAEKSIPAWVDTWVVDQAGILNASQESQINAYCKAIEAKTSMQFGVLTIDSLDGEPIESFAIRVFEKWKLGQAGKDNGCLFIVAVQDREYRIEVGYGLEGVLTDLKTGQIGRNVVEPKLGANDWSGGIMATVKALYETASGEVLEADDSYKDISTIDYNLNEDTKKPINTKILIIIGIIVLLIILDLIFTGGEITSAILISSSSSSSYHSSSHHSGGGGRSGGGGHSGHF